jgi:hypothetical protein
MDPHDDFWTDIAKRLRDLPGNPKHPLTQRKQAALESFDRLVTAPSVLTGEHKLSTPDADVAMTDVGLAEMLREFGGRREARTRDLRVANADVS